MISDNDYNNDSFDYGNEFQTNNLSMWDLCMDQAMQLDLDDYPEGTDYDDIVEAYLTGDFSMR